MELVQDDPDSRDEVPADGMSGLSLAPYNTSSMTDYNVLRNDSDSKQSPSKRGGSDTSTSNAFDRLQYVKTYFTNAGLKFRKPIAVGHQGGTVLFDKFDDDENGGEVLVKSLVVNYALDTQEDASSSNDIEFQNEMHWLIRMHNAEHVIQTEPEYWNL